MTDYSAEIERYLEEEMSSPERNAFLKRLKAEPDLAKEFDTRQKIRRTLHDREALAFHQKLKSIRRKRAAAGSKRMFSPVWRALLFFTALIACILLIWFITRPVPVPPPPVIRTIPDEKPSAPIMETPPQKDQALSPKKNNHHPPSPSPKLLALLEKEHREYLYSKINFDRFRTGTDTSVSVIARLFEEKNYSEVLRMAEKIPPDAEAYNSVVWAAANAAFLNNDCRQAFYYGKTVSELQESKTRAQDAEFLLLLTFLKCGKTADKDYQRLLKKCTDDVFHPAHPLAEKLKNL